MQCDVRVVFSMQCALCSMCSVEGNVCALFSVQRAVWGVCSVEGNVCAVVFS